MEPTAARQRSERGPGADEPARQQARPGARVFSIGHSTRTWDGFVELLEIFRIEVLADVRRFPASRRMPRFNREAMARALTERGIEYVWFERLGGRRSGTDDERLTDQSDHESQNDAAVFDGLRNSSFRAYARYMRTAPFREALDGLLRLATNRRVAMMCAEAVYWRCHRRLISDELARRGVAVQHIMSPTQLRPHRITDCAAFREDAVVYPPPLFGA